mmetsp:Transcript_49611/g.97762  ORF Transcript_49611/g.97762 Transcript_49611/m.97762 type:complete len:650 (-) Transcript_49611:119-2068(-)
MSPKHSLITFPPLLFSSSDTLSRGLLTGQPGQAGAGEPGSCVGAVRPGGANLHADFLCLHALIHCLLALPTICQGVHGTAGSCLLGLCRCAGLSGRLHEDSRGVCLAGTSANVSSLSVDAGPVALSGRRGRALIHIHAHALVTAESVPLGTGAHRDAVRLSAHIGAPTVVDTAGAPADLQACQGGGLGGSRGGGCGGSGGGGSGSSGSSGSSCGGGSGSGCGGGSGSCLISSRNEACVEPRNSDDGLPHPSRLGGGADLGAGGVPCGFNVIVPVSIHGHQVAHPRILFVSVVCASAQGSAGVHAVKEGVDRSGDEDAASLGLLVPLCAHPSAILREVGHLRRAGSLCGASPPGRGVHQIGGLELLSSSREGQEVTVASLRLPVVHVTLAVGCRIAESLAVSGVSDLCQLDDRRAPHILLCRLGASGEHSELSLGDPLGIGEGWPVRTASGPPDSKLPPGGGALCGSRAVPDGCFRASSLCCLLGEEGALLVQSLPSVVGAHGAFLAPHKAGENICGEFRKRVSGESGSRVAACEFGVLREVGAFVRASLGSREGAYVSLPWVGEGRLQSTGTAEGIVLPPHTPILLGTVVPAVPCVSDPGDCSDHRASELPVSVDTERSASICCVSLLCRDECRAESDSHNQKNAWRLH